MEFVFISSDIFFIEDNISVSIVDNLDCKLFSKDLCIIWLSCERLSKLSILVVFSSIIFFNCDVLSEKSFIIDNLNWFNKSFVVFDTNSILSFNDWIWKELFDVSICWDLANSILLFDSSCIFLLK